MADKIYVGSGKTITTKFGEMLSISFNKTDLQTMMDNLNEKGWINLNASPRKQPGKYGETHSISVYQSEAKTGNTRKEDITIDDISF